jgi:hypothetical protein
MTRSARRIRKSISAGARLLRLSIDATKIVTWVICVGAPAEHLFDVLSASSMCSAPRWWPRLTSSNPIWRAQRRLPSMMMARCRGTGPLASWARSLLA